MEINKREFLFANIAPEVDESVVQQLVDMGFNPNASRKAVICTGNSGLQAAADWVMLHLEDEDINVPYGEAPKLDKNNWVANEEGVASIEAMGFTAPQARKALQATDNNVERAIDWIFSHADELDNISSSASAPTGPSNQPKCSDGNGRKGYCSTKFTHLSILYNLRIQEG